MPPAEASASRLHRAAAAVAADERLPDGDARWLAAVLEALAAGASPATAAAVATRRERDELLREIRRRHFGDLAATAAADEIALVIGRYEATAWRIDRLRLECPHPAGSVRADLWRLLRLGAEVPARRRLFDILASMQSDPMAIA